MSEEYNHECEDCRYCNRNKYYRGEWYCGSPKVSIYDLPVDPEKCFEPRERKGGRKKMSRVLPILFNGDMVRAILREAPHNKKVTRRLVKGYIPEDAIWGYTMFTPKGYISCRGTFADGYGEKFFRLPCQPGDILYVRETWSKNKGKYRYREVWEKDGIADIAKWKPSIHMPKEAARIWLKVTDVRVERLQEISTLDCQHEGIDICRNGIFKRFSVLWDSTIKKTDIDRYGWKANPWVWVIEFERCGKLESEG